MIIAHISDLHFFHFPHFSGILTKRMIGLANLYFRGRIRHFDAGIARSAIQSVIQDRPDGVIISGDLTALGSPSEFETARQELEPLLERFSTVIVPGNHDFYTRGSVRSQRIEQYFGTSIRTPSTDEEESTFPSLHLIGEAVVIGLNPNRFTWAASGKIKEEELSRLQEILQLPAVRDRFTILVMHYPILNEGGRITWKFWRRLANPQTLLPLLKKYRVDLLLHGHDHRRYNNYLPPSSEKIEGTLLANAGSAGYSRGTYPASYNLYCIEDKKLVEVTFKDYHSGKFTISFQGPPSQIPDLKA